MQVQVPTIMKGDARMPEPGLVYLAGNIVLRMSGGHQHAGQHGNRLRPALDAALDARADHRLRELEEAQLNDPFGIVRAEALDEVDEFQRPVGIAAAVSDDQ